MSPRAEAKLAVIAVAHDSAHVLPAWIDALEALAPREQLELCVVDSGSSPAGLARAREAATGRVDHFLSLPNVGFGAGCNAGAATTTAPTLLFCNPDAEVTSVPARALTDGVGDDLLGAFAEDPFRPLGFAKLPTFREEASELALGRWSKAFRRSEDAPAWVSGAALMIDRRRFERLDGFSPAFFMYFEDADLCARHVCAGGTVELEPALVVRHAAGKSTDAEQSSRIGGVIDGINRQSGRRFAARYGRPWDAVALYLLLVFAYLPRRIASIVAHRDPLGPSVDYCLDVLSPRRGLRKIGAQQEGGGR
jgi:hypothetical protein